MKKIAVILSGCGFKDGSEITEAVSTLIGISITGAEHHCFAPKRNFPVTNHLLGTPTPEERDILTEAARIARGKIRDITELQTADFDALIMPGGFGAATNLCDWATKGAACQVLPSVAKVVTEFYQAKKPIGAICIAPVILGKVLGHKHITLTLGEAGEAAEEIAKTGAKHQVCAVDDIVVDTAHKIVTTPAYMYGKAKPAQVFTGIQSLTRQIMVMLT